MLESLSVISSVKADQLHVSYLTIVPHDTSTRTIGGNGVGVLELSKIFFSDDHNWALVYFEFTCGVKCNHGEFAYLHQGSNEWRIVERLEAWIDSTPSSRPPITTLPLIKSLTFLQPSFSV